MKWWSKNSVNGKNFFLSKSNDDLVLCRKMWKEERKKIVSLLKFAIAQNHQSMVKIYHLYTFQNRVESFWQCWFSLKWLMRMLSRNQWIVICSAKSCWYKSMLSLCEKFLDHFLFIHPLMPLIKFFCYSLS